MSLPPSDVRSAPERDGRLPEREGRFAPDGGGRFAPDGEGRFAPDSEGRFAPEREGRFAPERDLAGRFAVLRTLGTGASGVVQLALDRLAGDQVVLKTCAGSDARRRAALRREAELVAGLGHSGLPRLRSFARDAAADLDVLALEFVDGQPLAKLAGRRGPGEVAQLLADVLATLEFLHARGFVHADLKPENVIVHGAPGSAPRAVLIDLGFAASLAQGGGARGTPRYAAPSILAGVPPTVKSDLFALGASFRETFAGSLAADSAGAEGELAARLAELLERLAAPDEDARQATAQAALRELRGLGVAPPAVQAEPAFVGRGAQIERWLARFRLRPAGVAEPFVSIVAAESGAGRTRFLAELARAASFAGGTAIEIGGAPDPYAELTARLTRGGFLAADEPQSPAHVARSLCRALDRPVLLVDDFDRAGAEARAQVLELANGPDGTGLALVLAVRSLEGGPWPGGSEIVQLERLAEPTSLALARSVLAVGPAAGELARRIARATEGLPAHVSLAAQAVAALESSAPSAAVDRAIDAALPAVARDELQRAVLALPEPERGLARWLSAFARPFPVALAEEVARGAGFGEPAAHGLARRGLLRETGGELEFASERLRRFLFASLEAGERARALRSVADALLAGGALAEEHADVVARLFLEIGETERALHFGTRALEQQLARQQPVEACGLAEALLAAPAAQGNGELEALHRLAGRARAGVGDLEGALAAFARCSSAGDLELDCARAAAHVGLGELDRAEAILSAAVKVPPGAAAPPSALASAHEAWALVAVRRGQKAEAARRLREGMAFLDPEQDPAAALLWNDLGVLAFEQADFAEARRCHRRALAIRERHADREGAGRSWNNLGNLALLGGDYAEARACYARALDLKRAIGDARSIAVTESNLGVLAQWQARFGDALAHHAEALALRRARGDMEGQVRSRTHVAEVWLEKGALRKAAEEVHEALRVARALGRRDEALAEASLVAARVELGLGRLARAEGLARAGQSIAAECESRQDQALIAAALAQIVHCAYGDGAAAARELGAAERAARALGAPRCLAQVLIARAGIAGAGGDREGAEAAGSEASELAERLGATALQGEAILLLGQGALRAGRMQLAGERLRLAEELARRAQLAELEWASAAALAEFHSLNGRRERALLWLSRCTQSLKSIVRALGDPELERTYLAAPWRARIFAELAPAVTGVGARAHSRYVVG